MAFKFASSESIVRKAGGWASSSITSSASFLSQISEEAEAWVNNQSRRIWNNTYDDLDVNVRTTLQEVTSNVGGIYILSWDPTRFSNRIDSENVLNILWARAEKGIKLLTDQKGVTFIKNS